MEGFKIEHFNKDNPSIKFPKFSALSPKKADKIYQKLSVKLGKDILPQKIIVKKIFQLGVLIEGINADEDDFVLKKVFDSIGIIPLENVYINWYHFDDIDEIRFSDLDRYFDHIWYPGPDDIDIFDQSFSWILSISHDGSINILNLLKFVE